MKRLLVLAVVAALTISGLAGCSYLNKLSQWDVKQTDQAAQASVNFIKVWPYYSGLIRGALGANLQNLPANAVSAMDELDKLAAKTEAELTLMDKGYVMGYHIRALGSIVSAAIKEYYPDVFKLLPAALQWV